MLFLLLSVICAVCAGLAYKFAVTHGCRRFPLIMVERIIIVAALLLASLGVSGFKYDVRVLMLSLFAVVGVISARWTLMRALALGKAGLSYTIWNLAVIVPVIASIFLFKELPTVAQGLGIVLVLAGIVLMRELDQSVDDNTMSEVARSQRRKWFVLILLCFIVEGLFATLFKVIKEWGLEESRNLFILFFSMWAFLICLGIVIRARQIPTKKEIAFAAWTGLSIGGCGFFAIIAIIQLQGIVYFPTATALSIGLLLLASLLIWRERTTPLQTTGLFVSLAGVVLVLIG